MRSSVQFLLSLLCSGMLAGSFSQAFAVTEKEVDNLVIVYRQGKYLAAEAIAKALLEQDPGNLRVHYYLANCCVKLLKLEEAEEQYSICVETGKGTKIAELSTIGLQRLEQITNSTTLASSARMAGASTDLKQLQMRIKQQTAVSRAQALAEAETARRKIRDRYLSPGLTTGNEQAEIARIDATYRKRLADLSNREIAILSQAGGNQKTNLMPLGSNLYVQNYVNFGDDNIEEIPLYAPLKATAKSLPDLKSTTKKNGPIKPKKSKTMTLAAESKKK